MVTNSTYQSGPGDQSMSALPKRKAGSKLTSGHLLMILSGLAAFLLIITLLGSQSASITVYIAKDDIFAGQEISISNFEAKSIPSSDINDQYFQSDDFKDGKVYASRLISKGEPLLKQDQTPKSEDSSVRLQSIPISKKFAVNGTLAKGDTIDIIETPEDGCAYRAMADLKIASVSGGSSGSALGGGDSTYTITVSLEEDGDDLILAGVIARESFQIVRSTGTNRSTVNEDTQCGSPVEQ